MSYDSIHMGHPLVPGSPYYTFEYECECGWEYNEDDGDWGNDICPHCEKELTYTK